MKNIGLIVLLVILVQGSMVSASSDSDSAGEILSEDIAYVLGRYHLEYPEVTREGLFTSFSSGSPRGGASSTTTPHQALRNEIPPCMNRPEI